MKFRNIALILSGLSLAVFSCKKDDDNDDDDQNLPAHYGTTSTADNSVADRLFSDMFNQLDAAASDEDSLKSGNSTLSSCATVTIQASNNPSASNPNEIWVDYGSGCTDSSGVYRKGLIHATITGKYRDSNTVITIDPQNYHVNQYKVEGVKTVTNEGHNSDGNLWYTIEVDSVTIADTVDNWTATWESDRTREWIEGEGTYWNPWDDVYLIDGVASGTNRSGRDYDVEILSELRVEIGCPYIVSGMLEVEPDSLATRQVDYGSGTCDSKIVVTVNGNDYTIYWQ